MRVRPCRFPAKETEKKIRNRKTKAVKTSASLRISTTLSILLFTSAGPLCAQGSNPLETNSNVWNSREVLVMWGQAGSDGPDRIRQAMYGIDFTEYLQEGQAPWETVQEAQDVPTDLVNTDPRPVSAVAADIDGTGRDRAYWAAVVPGGVRVTIPNISVTEDEDGNAAAQMGTPLFSVMVDTGVNTGNQGQGYVKTAAGDFDGDGQEELVLAVRKSDGNILVQVMDPEGSSTPFPAGSIEIEGSVTDGYGYEVFDICAGDFNGNGKDDIAVVTLHPASGNGGAYAVQLNFFEVTGEASASVEPRAFFPVDNGNILPYDGDFGEPTAVRAAVTALKTQNINAEQPDRALVTFAFTPYDDDTDDPQENVNMLLFELSSDLQGAGVLSQLNTSGSFESQHAFGLRTGDMNGDRMQEAVLLIGNEFRVYSFAENAPELKAVIGNAQNEALGQAYQADKFEIADLDKNGRENIITGSYTTSALSNNWLEFYLRSIELNTDWSPGPDIQTTVVSQENYGNAAFWFGLAPGNFDGNDLKLGEPTFHECTYTRPLFILAPPPIHFDHLDGENFDPTGCFTSGSCGFSATNISEQQTETNLKITTTSDWDVSTTVSAGFEGVYASVGASMSARYGEQFSNATESGLSEAITVETTATVDDQIRGVRYPVHVYEYPVLNAADEVISYVSAAFPQYDQKEEYLMQGKLDPNYVPYYEPGNLLSYPRILDTTSFVNSSAGMASLIYQGNTYSVNNNVGSGNSVTIAASNIYGETGSESWNAGATLGLSASGFGLGFETEGNYNTGGMKINGTVLEGNESFGINYEHIAGSTGFYRYDVRPYLFWNRDGTGMLAYQVNLHSNQASPTFWDLTYGEKSDPALMMPYRNEAYYTSGSPEDTPLFTMSKSMTFDRLYPATGEPVTVQCRVHNYSLRNTPEPVKVRFYNGHPDNGGELISSIDGQTTFETDGPVQSREMKTVEMTFAMPMPLNQGDSFVRFYALLDPDDDIDEIHEGNNLGWQVLGYDCDNNIVTSTNDAVREREQSSEMWVWPNPARDRVNCAFDLSRSTRAELLIFDLHGRSVASRDLGSLAPGKQEVSLPLPDLPAGMYVTYVSGDGLQMSKKLVIE